MQARYWALFCENHATQVVFLHNDSKNGNMNIIVDQ